MNALLPNKCVGGKTFLKIIKMLLQISLCWKEKSSEINKRAALLLGTPEYLFKGSKVTACES